MKKDQHKKNKAAPKSGFQSEAILTHRPFKKINKECALEQALLPEFKEEPTRSQALDEAVCEEDDEVIYAREMALVTPIDDSTKYANKDAKAKPPILGIDEEELVMRKLDELVFGDTPFDFADTDEYIEAVAEGIDRRLVRQLKRGEFSIQAHLDLHGLNREQAREKVAAFIRVCHREGKRSVLIVHGRGKGSKDNIPVLKNKLAFWLTRGATGRHVLAFTSARPYDGGTGAVYVLLRSRGQN